MLSYEYLNSFYVLGNEGKPLRNNIPKLPNYKGLLIYLRKKEIDITFGAFCGFM